MSAAVVLMLVSVCMRDLWCKPKVRLCLSSPILVRYWRGHPLRHHNHQKRPNMSQIRQRRHQRRRRIRSGQRYRCYHCLGNDLCSRCYQYSRVDIGLRSCVTGITAIFDNNFVIVCVLGLRTQTTVATYRVLLTTWPKKMWSCVRTEPFSRTCAKFSCVSLSTKHKNKKLQLNLVWRWWTTRIMRRWKRVNASKEWNKALKNNPSWNDRIQRIERWWTQSRGQQQRRKYDLW